MEVNYFQIWHRHLRQGVEALSPDQAKARHDSVDGYVAVIGTPKHPECFIEIREGFYGVSFLDSALREYLMYSFEELESGMLFLKEAIFREYDGDNTRPARASAYRFQPSGSVSVESGAHPFRQVSVKESTTNVRRNWERKPAFGQYADIVRKERLAAES